MGYSTILSNYFYRGLVASFLMVQSISCYATDYYVNDANLLGDIYCSGPGNNSNDGSSVTPFATLTHVINSVGLTPGDRVYVDAGVYYQTDITLVINVSNIQIIGAGAGSTTFDNSGGGGTQEFFMEIVAPATNVLLQGFTLTGYDYEPGSKGKAITVSGATGVTLDGIHTVSNRENGDAAIMVLSNSEVDILNGISSCNQVSYGGGIQVEGVNIDVLIDNCIIAQNRKTAFNGGGVLIVGTSGASSNVIVTIQNSTIQENWAARGGGVYVEGATLNVSNSCFDANVLSASYESGGGLFVGYNATVSLNQCSFINNTADKSSADGGAIGVNAQNSTVDIQQCFFSGNTANDDGNAIYADRAYSSSTAIVTINESIFQTSPAQNIYRKSDASVTMTYSGTRQVAPGSFSIRGNDVAQSLGMPVTNCPTSSNPCMTVLPVELISFTGSCRKADNILHFSTASENNNDYFIIEKLNTYNQFEEVGIVEAIGNSSSILSYEYIDRAVDGKDSYYRLTQVDVNGVRAHLSTISVKGVCAFDSEITSVSIFGDELIIDYSIKEDKEYHLELYTTAGKLVYSSVIELNKYDSHARLSTTKSFSNGCYLVRMSNPTTPEFNSKLVVNK